MAFFHKFSAELSIIADWLPWDWILCRLSNKNAWFHKIRSCISPSFDLISNIIGHLSWHSWYFRHWCWSDGISNGHGHVGTVYQRHSGCYHGCILQRTCPHHREVIGDIFVALSFYLTSNFQFLGFLLSFFIQNGGAFYITSVWALIL